MTTTLPLEPHGKDSAPEDYRGPAMLDDDVPQGRRGAFHLIRNRDLVIARWILVAAQAVGVFGIAQLMKLSLPIAPITLLIGLAVVMNIAATLLSSSRRLSSLEQMAYLVFDCVQLTSVLALTGGSVNPFCLALIFPARMAAMMLSSRDSVGVCLMLLGMCVILVISPFPIPWPPGIHIVLPWNYRILCGIADGLGVVIGYGFGWWTARQAARMEFALHLTDTYLGRQQRLMALGGLAAAAAHELGTPLTTIAVIAKEMARDAPQGPLREDAWLLVEQAGRCRDILRRLAQEPDTRDALQSRVDLDVIVDELSEPFTARQAPSIVAMVTGPRNQSPPTLWRLPEVHPALSSIVENAMDFGREQVRVIGRFDSRFVSVEVRDDGPGFAPEILARLGEPYVTSRADAELSRNNHIGMGLGVFIAKTLLERTGARVTFHNARPRGAVVTARWRRAHLEATPLVDAGSG
jgi:two-component system sensor histidine kinase RegB